MLSDESLAAMYKNNFILVHDYKYSFEELDNMLPYEREIYIAMLMQKLEKIKENERKKATY